MRIAEAEGQQDVLREHLSKLVGLAPAEMAVACQSFRAATDLAGRRLFRARRCQQSLGALAEQKAVAADAHAKGEHRALPFADLASQYAYLARFNNYDLYFLRYSANNLAAV